MYTYQYPHPAVTTDCVIFGYDVREGLSVLLIQRGLDPFKGRWAFPGGFLRMDEDADTGARRELKEETGLDVCITELDMSILPTLTRSADLGEMSFAEAMSNPEIRARMAEKFNPYANGIPEDIYKQWNDRMADFLNMFVRNSDVIRRVNVWGICDSDSWKNGWPIPERQDSPLWFDRNYKLKPFLHDYLYGR